MRFEYRLEPDDFRALVEASGLRRRFGQPPPWLWYGLGALNVAIGALRIALIGPAEILSGWYHWALAAFSIAAPWLYRAYMRRAARRHPSHGHTIHAEFTAREMVAAYQGLDERISYTAFRSLDERPDHLLLWLDGRRAVILPKRALAAAGRTAGEVAALIEGGKAMARDEDGAVPEAESAAPAPAPARTPWVRRADPGPVFEKTVVAQLEDHLAVDYADGRIVRPLPIVASAALAALGVSLFFAFPFWQEGRYVALALMLLAALAIGLAAGTAVFFLLRWGITRMVEKDLRKNGHIGQPARLRFDRDGVEGEGGGAMTRWAWSAFIDVEKDDLRFYFWCNTTSAVVLRIEALDGPEEIERFGKAVTEWYGRPPRTPPRMARERVEPLSEPPAPPAREPE